MKSKITQPTGETFISTTAGEFRIRVALLMHMLHNFSGDRCLFLFLHDDWDSPRVVKFASRHVVDTGKTEDQSSRKTSLFPNGTLWFPNQVRGAKKDRSHLLW